MQGLLAVSRLIDAGTRRLGQWVAWLVIAAAIISAGNAVSRKLFDLSSNAWLELQWWLFSAVFLLAAPWTLALNEHIRIDILNQRFSPRVRNIIEIVGITLFLMPMAAIVVWTSWPFFVASYEQNEQSSNFGGLVQWPAKLLIPVAFAILFIQGVSELIKRIAIMRGELAETEPAVAHPAARAGALGPPASPVDRRRRETTNASGRTRGGRVVELIAENLAPIMFAALVLFLLLGYPVAFSLAAVGLAFFVIGVELAPYSGGIVNLSWPLLRTLPERIFGVMSNETLLAIPFFAFMGLILERSGMAEDLLETVGQLFGTVRGGLAYAVIFVGALLAATTGVVAASVISMGLISLPIMLRYGYDARFATGTIAASGTLAQIIPPSLVLIVLADQLGRSVGDMYTGALVPGLMLAASMRSTCSSSPASPRRPGPGCRRTRSRFRRADGSRGYTSLVVLTLVSARHRLGRDAHTPSYHGADLTILTMGLAVAIAFLAALASALLEWGVGRRLLSPLAEQVVFVMVPPLLLIFLVLGTIFVGVATPTEGGAMGAVGAMLLAYAKRVSDRNPAPLQPGDRALGRRGDGEAVGLRHVHSHRRAHLLADVLRRERPQVGRAPARVAAGRRGGLPRLRQRAGVLPRLLPRFLRARLHHRAAARARPRPRSASTSSGSA